MSDFDRFDVDRVGDYDFYYDENIYKNGRGIRRTQNNIGIIGTITYLGMMGIGLLIAALCPPVGILFILGAYSLRDKLK